jgi:hypothetical protein
MKMENQIITQQEIDEMIAEDLRNEADYEIESYQIERDLEND